MKLLRTANGSDEHGNDTSVGVIESVTGIIGSTSFLVGDSGW